MNLFNNIFLFFLFHFFTRDISKTAEPIFTKSYRKMANGSMS